jgi:hypothetical protein
MPDMNFPTMPDLHDARLRRLGPATITGVAGSQIEAEADGRRLMATLAVPSLYAPVEGDIVLIIEAGEAAYVIGVLNASGPMTITAPGDLRLAAPHGALTLSSASLCASAGEISLNAENLNINAGQLRESFGAVRRFVSGLFDFEAGEFRARIAETFGLSAKRVTANAREDVKIDGQRIHLG